MKLKEWLEKIGIGVATSLIVLVLTAVIKGESLNGLLKISGLFQFLKTGVPLWLFLITLIAGLLGSLQWIRHVISKQAVLRVVWRPEVCL